MSIQNTYPDYAGILDLSISDVAELPDEVIAELHGQAVDKALQAVTIRKRLEQGAYEKHREVIKTTGTSHTDAFTFVIPESVKWDQSGLTTLQDELSREGLNPDIYIKEKTSLTVSKTAYDNWPEDVQRRFRAHRTVSHGAMKFTCKVQS